MTAAKLWSAQLADGFTRHFVIIEGRSESAAKKYVLTAAKFFDFIATRNEQPDRPAVEAWMRHLYQECKNKSNATRASRLSGLRSVCRWMVDKKHLGFDPTEGVPTPRFSPTAARKFSTPDLQALMSAPDPDSVIGIRDKAILMLFYVTGMRRQEMSDMTLDRLHLTGSGGYVTIRGKGAKHRSVGFGKAIIPIMRKWLVTRAGFAGAKERHLFIAIHAHSKDAAGLGLGTSGMNFVMKRAAEAIHMRSNEAFLHKLRATYATDLYDAGYNVGEIRILMGHANEMTTWRYIAISQRHLERTRIPDDRITLIAGDS
jgi:integrase/recombinase XerD